MSLLELTPAGLYCAAGDFFIDPWQPVARAIVTHAHGDHLRPGSAAYLVAAPGEALPTARPTSSTGSASPFTPPATSSARPRYASSTRARSGSSAATTSSS